MLSSFIDWFLAESDRLRYTASAQVADELATRLATIDDRIGVEVERDTTSSRRELILTGFSDPDVFPVIFRIAHALNEVEGWKIVPLKPARGFEFSVTVGGKKVEAKKLRFRAINGIPNGFQIVAPGMLVSGEGAEEVAWLIVETGIGEKLSGQISHLEFGVPQDEQETRPITDLDDCIRVNTSPAP